MLDFLALSTLVDRIRSEQPMDADIPGGILVVLHNNATGTDIEPLSVAEEDGQIRIRFGSDQEGV